MHNRYASLGVAIDHTGYRLTVDGCLSASAAIPSLVDVLT